VQDSENVNDGMHGAPPISSEEGLASDSGLVEARPFNYSPKNWLTGVIVALYHVKPVVKNCSAVA